MYAPSPQAHIDAQVLLPGIHRIQEFPFKPFGLYEQIITGIPAQRVEPKPAGGIRHSHDGCVFLIGPTPRCSAFSAQLDQAKFRPFDRPARCRRNDDAFRRDGWFHRQRDGGVPGQLERGPLFLFIAGRQSPQIQGQRTGAVDDGHAARVRPERMLFGPTIGLPARPGIAYIHFGFYWQFYLGLEKRNCIRGEKDSFPRLLMVPLISRFGDLNGDEIRLVDFVVK
jgi:hypothetical protein